MELKTDGGIYITREEYKKFVEKVMDRQAKAAMMATLITCIKNGIDPDNVADGANSALNLQKQALDNMERLLFGKVAQEEEAKDE